MCFLRLAFVCSFLVACGSVTSDTDAPVGDPDPDAEVIVEPDAMVEGLAPVTSFAADGSASGPAVYSLSWTNPTPAPAGVLVLRSDGPTGDRPVDGTSYTAGDTIGSSTVVFVGAGTSAEDLTAWGGHTFTYSAFAFDQANRYSDKAEDDARAEIYFRGTVAVSGATVTVTPDQGSGGLAFSGTVTPTKGTIVTLSFVNQTDRHFYNAKFLVREGAALVTSDGIHDGSPFRTFGPEATLIDGTSPARDFFIGADGDFSFVIELARHPMVVVSRNSPVGVVMIDTGRDAVVATPETAAGFTNNVWFNAISRDGRWIWMSEHYQNGVLFFDQSTLTVANRVVIAPPAGGMEASTNPAAIVPSSDESTLYVAVSGYDETNNILMVVRIDVASASEVDRLVLDSQSAAVVGQRAPARGLALDQVRNRLYVPNYTYGVMHVVDLATFTQVDTDGVPDNGVTPVSFGGEPHLSPSGVAIHPDGTRAYVNFGRRTNRDVAELDLDDLSTITYLPLTFVPTMGEEFSSSPNIQFGPDGRLWVPRTQYPTDGVSSYGISVFDVNTTPVVEQGVNIIGSTITYQNDLWDIVFIPQTTRAYGSMADEGYLNVYDYTTLQPIDVDLATAGHQNINADVPVDGYMYGGGLVVTPY